MGQEIERKYLVRSRAYRNASSGILYRQAYLSSSPERTVRVRIFGQKGYLTVKGPSEGCKRLEFEYEIPYDEAQTMIDNLCEKPIIEKYRYKAEYEGSIWSRFCKAF
jgi:CYTH domain-containing protein